MLGSAPDLLRLLVVPLFAWAAVRDVRTRRIPNRVWPPLYLFGVVLLVWETVVRWPLAGIDGRLFLIRVAISLLFVAPLGYAFWFLGGFGGADAKALIGLAIVFPTFPVYYLPVAWLPALPAVQTHIGVFSLTILTNTVILGACYPIGLGLYNAFHGRRSPVMVLARPVPVERLSRLHGRLFETRSGFTRSGLDLDALRMYLRWRGVTLADVRAEPDRFRDPATVAETFDPTDGAAHLDPVTDGGDVSVPGDGVGSTDGAEQDTADAETVVGTRGGPEEPEESSESGEPGEPGKPEESSEPGEPGEPGKPEGPEGPGEATPTDVWAAERFLEDIEGTAYGTDPKTLREGLETVTSADEVWISPGMPFVVPMFLGLVVALVFGDVLFAILAAVGWV